MSSRVIDPVDQILMLDPAAAYGDSDAGTRALYRGRVNVLAARAGVPRETVARRVVDAADRGMRNGVSPASSHVGYYLTDAGGPQIEDELGVRHGLIDHIQHLVPARGSSSAEAIYMAAVTAAVLLVEAGLLALEGWRAPLSVLALLIATVPIATYYVTLAARGAMRAVSPPRLLPRLARTSSLIADENVLLVIPTILSSRERVREVVDRMLELARAHPEPRFRFAMLSDFSDAASESTPDDARILAEAGILINDLNARHRDDRGDRFFLLHRRRTWSPGQGAWIGWERKRGKLLELFRYLTNSAKTTTFSLVFGDLQGLLERSRVRYVLSCDERSWLDSASTWSLLCTAAHPLNRAETDERTNRVRRGYGIIQPALRLVPRHTMSQARAAQLLGHGVPVIAPSFPFDSFGAGVNRGRAALYDVAVCSKTLDDAFPVESVLHHDLLEGFVARTGDSRHARVLQPRDDTYLARLTRGHRWLRGMFQSLPWVFPRVRNARGERVANPLDGFHRFYIAELTLLQLQQPASLALLVWGWMERPAPLLLWTIFVCPALIQFVLSLSRVSRSRKGGGMLLSEAFAAAFGLTVLAIEAVLVLDALVRALWRMAVSRKRLLDWVTHTAEANAPRTQRAYWNLFWPSAALAVATLVAVIWHQPASVVAAAPIVVAWIVAPSLVWRADRSLFAS